MHKIAFLNQKGGVGKTTSVFNIGAGLARLGKTVLLVDCDAQANLSCSLGVEEPKQSLYNMLNGNAEFSDVAVPVGEMTLLPASLELAGLEHEVGHMPKREYLLNKVLQNVDGYDYVLIDCPPSLGLLTINALAYADEVYIPVQTEFLALHGLGQLIETITAIKQRINPDLRIGGIIGTRFNRRRINKEVVQYLQDNFQYNVFSTVIRENVKLTESPSYAQDIYTYNPHCNGAYDYNNLCKEIIQQHSQ